MRAPGNRSPLVSLVMPVYDDVEHLRAAVDRALGQTGVDVELVVVDDGSTDGSREVATAAAAADDRVVVRLMPENGGVAAARRAGVEAASGEWVWFVDSDDGWPADGAQLLLAALRDAGSDPAVDVVVGTAALVEPDGTRRTVAVPPPGRTWTGQEALRLLLRGEVTGHLWTKLVRRSLLLGVDFPRSRVQSDMALVANALAAASGVRATEAQVYEYRKRPGSIITSAHQRADSLEVVEAVVVAAARRCGVLDTDPDLRWFRLRYIALSGLKDAFSGAYPPPRSRELVARARRGIGVRGLLILAGRRDKRLVLALLAFAPRRLQVRLLGRR